MMPRFFLRLLSLFRQNFLRFNLWILLVAMVVVPDLGRAAPASLEIPEPLKPWVGWVKYQLPELECARLPGGGQQWPRPRE